MANGNNSVEFSVIARDASQNLMQNPNYKIYVNGSQHSSNIFQTTVAGQYDIYAKFNSIQSNIITIKAEEVKININSIKLSTNTSLIIADGNSKANLSVIFLDENNNQINNVSSYDIVDNGNVLTNRDFNYSTTTSGNHNILIRADNVESNMLSINARENINYNQISVPVIFHIVHFGENIGSGTNLTQDQVTSILNNLNNGFSNQYGSNNPNAVDTKITFRRAILDSNNNTLSEPGIDRINANLYGTDYGNDKLIGPNDDMGTLFTDNSWNPRLYLNIWIYPLQQGGGTATYPWVYESQPLNGILTVPDNCLCEGLDPWIGVDPTAGNNYVIIHEVGHAFGLLHNFSTDNCNTSDYCPDTYSYNINNTSQACSDNLGTMENDNFMDYTYAPTTFTYDQRERIHHVFKYGLFYNELKNSNQ